MEQTTMVAAQYRLQKWAEQVKECNNRPQGMRVSEWCEHHGITKANYYYRLKQVRKAYLAEASQKNSETLVVPIPLTTAVANTQLSSTLELSTNGISIQVTETTSMDLLTKVLKVISHA
ncbi:MAG: IS66 family insertion sequence element accessory protein TnpA [Lachnospiraceae bacterium]